MPQVFRDLGNTLCDRLPIGGCEHQQQDVVAQLPEVRPGSAPCGITAQRPQAKDCAPHDALGEADGNELLDVDYPVDLYDGDCRGFVTQRGDRDQFLETAHEATPIQLTSRALLGIEAFRLRMAGQRGTHDADRHIQGLDADPHFEAAPVFLESGLCARPASQRVADQLPGEPGRRLGPDSLDGFSNGVGCRFQRRDAASSIDPENRAVTMQQHDEIGQRFEKIGRRHARLDVHDRCLR